MEKQNTKEKMNVKTWMALLGVWVLCSCTAEPSMEKIVEKGLRQATEQALVMARSLENEKDSLPRSIDTHGKLVKSDPHWWCSGFFPGTLWYLYEATGDTLLKRFAEDYTRRVADQQYTTDNHDVGFILNCSFGNGYRLTKKTEYAGIMLNGARSLSTRYKPAVGLIRSWDDKADKWRYPVIIDNMMNLELLEWAYHYSDSAELGNIAMSHAMKTLENHFRDDFSSYHVVSYNPETGIPEQKNTHQGYAHESAWARGQAWGLYGFTMMYRETGDSLFLEQAKNIAKFIMRHPNLPEDKIPYWDFNAPDIPHARRDASAGAIMASAFIELGTLIRTDAPELSGECLLVAEKQLRTLTSSHYLAKTGTNGGFILKHSVGNHPKGTEVDVPLTYADYYYVEALLRYKKLQAAADPVPIM